MTSKQLLERTLWLEEVVVQVTDPESNKMVTPY
jgi:hypothetical protein